MSELKPQLKPRFWIIRAPDGSRSVRTAKFAYVTIHDIKQNLSLGWIVEEFVEPCLTDENQKLFEAFVHLDSALEPRTTPHLRDLFGELFLRGYEAGRESKKGG